MSHARVTDSDLEWMAPAEMLLLWNVQLPDGFLPALPRLRGVSLRGGTGVDLRAVEGCTQLLMVDVNQIRGLNDLSQLSSLTTLEYLSLYGLPRVATLPDLGDLCALRHLQLGSMKGLQSLAGVASIPELRTLWFIRAVNIAASDVEMLAGHPTLEAFTWSSDDVPHRVTEPVVKRLSHLAKTPLTRPEQWLEKRLGAT